MVSSPLWYSLGMGLSPKLFDAPSTPKVASFLFSATAQSSWRFPAVQLQPASLAVLILVLCSRAGLGVPLVPLVRSPRPRLGRAAASEQQCRTAMCSPPGRRAPLFLQPQRPTAASALSSAQLIASRHRYGPLLALAFSLAELVSFGEPRVERRARMPRRRARPRALFTCPIRRKTQG